MKTKSFTDKQRFDFLIKNDYHVVENNHPKFGRWFEVLTHDKLQVAVGDTWCEAVNRAIEESV